MNEELAYALGLARHKLRPHQQVSAKPLSALAAAAFFAVCAMTFAAAAILAPANEKIAAARTGVQ